MTLQVTESVAALIDLYEIADYLTDKTSPEIAHRVIEAIRQSYELLAIMPNAGTKRAFDHSQLHGLRMWTVSGYPNYLIFYDTTDEEVIIRRVLHGARDIDAILSEST